MSDRIPRFDAPTLDDLADLPCTPEVRETVRALLCGELLPGDVSARAKAWSDRCYNRPCEDGHEMILKACDDLLGTSGVEAIAIEGESFTDEGIRLCPPFSYCNAGDTYDTTLMRDHANGSWLVASWGDALEEYEQENGLGDYARFDEAPDACPSCWEKAKFEPKARGWECASCGHFCLAVDGLNPLESETEEEED